MLTNHSLRLERKFAPCGILLLSLAVSVGLSYLNTDFSHNEFNHLRAYKSITHTSFLELFEIREALFIIIMNAVRLACANV